MGKFLKFMLSVGLIIISSGCVVRTYTVTKDRVDQNLTSGNQGYLAGNAPPIDESSRRKTRTTYVAEVEVGPTQKPPKMKTAAKEPAGKEGYEEGPAGVKPGAPKPVEPT